MSNGKSRPGRFWMRPSVYLGAAAALSVAIMLAIALGWLDEDQRGDLKLTAVETAGQLVVFGILGGLIKTALDDHKALTEFRTSVLAELGKAHAQIYALRRTLVLRGHEPELVRECLFEMMTVRNELGSVGHTIRGRLSQDEVDTVLKNITRIRGYLEELIKESIHNARDGQITIGPELEAFIAGCRGGSNDTYERRFKAPYLHAKQAADPNWKPDSDQQRTMAMLDESEPASA